jgi:hypothetical protein
MLSPDLAERLHSAIDGLLKLDNEAVCALPRLDPSALAPAASLPVLTAPNLHVVKQDKPLAALKALLLEVRASAQANGYSALEVEQRCDKLRAACVEEQCCCIDYLAAAWDNRVFPPEREDRAQKWARSLISVKHARDYVTSMLVDTPGDALRKFLWPKPQTMP